MRAPTYKCRRVPFSIGEAHIAIPVAGERGFVEVLNDTADFYRYFDTTPHTEFIYECVRRTVESDLPDEMRFLRASDEFSALIEGVVGVALHVNRRACRTSEEVLG